MSLDTMLAELQKGTRRAGRGEVESRHPASTRGTGESTVPARTAQVATTGPDRVRLAAARIFAREHSEGDVLLMRERLRSPWLLTQGEPCPEECPDYWRQPRRYLGLVIAVDVCELDGTCAYVERQVMRATSVAEQKRVAAAWRARREERQLRLDAYYRGGGSLDLPEWWFEPLPDIDAYLPALEPTPTERLAAGPKIDGRKARSKITDEQLDAVLAKLAEGAILNQLCTASWHDWGYSSQISAVQSLRRRAHLRRIENAENGGTPGADSVASHRASQEVPA